MIKEYNQKSLLFGLPGLILQYIGIGRQPIVSVIGAILLFIGLAFYAKAKDRHPAWCLMALLSLLVIIFLALMKDLTKGEESDSTNKISE